MKRVMYLLAATMLTVACGSPFAMKGDRAAYTRGVTGMGQRFVLVAFYPENQEVRPVSRVEVNDVEVDHAWSNRNGNVMESTIFLDIRTEEGLFPDSTYASLFDTTLLKLTIEYEDGSEQELAVAEL